MESSACIVFQIYCGKWTTPCSAWMLDGLHVVPGPPWGSTNSNEPVRQWACSQACDAQSMFVVCPLPRTCTDRCSSFLALQLHLKHLTLGHSNGMRAQTLRQICQLPSLQSLHLSRKQLPPGSHLELAHLPTCLRTLSLTWVNGTSPQVPSPGNCTAMRCCRSCTSCNQPPIPSPQYPTHLELPLSLTHSLPAT